MKFKFSIVIIVLSLGIFQHGIGQRIKGAVLVGTNLTQVDGDEIYGYSKFGLNLGVMAIVPLPKNFSFSIETIFSQKGSQQKAQYESTDSTGNVFTGAYKLSLNYLEVPFLVRYTDRDKISFGTGFSYGRLVGVKEYEHGKRVETTTLNDGPYNKSDINVLADLEFRIYKKLKFDIRYAYSVAKIRTREFTDIRGLNLHTRKQYNNVLSFRIMYVINEKPAPVAKEK